MGMTGVPTGVVTEVGQQMERVRVPPYRDGGEFTVGVEDELMLVDAAGDLLGAEGTGLVDRLRSSGRTGVVTGEVYAD